MVSAGCKGGDFSVAKEGARREKGDFWVRFFLGRSVQVMC